MLHTLLVVLKIIGIILLILLGIVLLLVICSLFLPMRYRVEVTRTEGEDEPPVRIKGKITWFLHILNVRIRYPAETIVLARVFFIPVYALPKKEKQKKHKTEKKADSAEGSSDQKDETDSIETTPSGQEEKEDAGAASPEIIEDVAENKKEQQALADQNEKKAEERSEIPHVTIKGTKTSQEETEEKTPLKDRISLLWEFLKKIILQIRNLFQNIQYTIQNICDKIKSVLENIQYYREVIESDIFRQSFGLCKGELVYLLKKLKPDKLKADFIVGMDDPAATGEILAIYGMLYPMIGSNINVTGDFENKRMEGSLIVKGHLNVYTFLKIAVKLYFNKDIKKLIRLLKKEAV